MLNASIQLRNLAVGDTATERLYQQLLNAKRYLSAQYVRPTDERLGVPELENDIAELEKTSLVRCLVLKMPSGKLPGKRCKSSRHPIRLP
ncbi:MAG: hypothetical protein H6574_14370 [Lewinellaceae bacterium]|nr:hypothetical protein [Lewinellaceae bacterium]